MQTRTKKAFMGTTIIIFISLILYVIFSSGILPFSRVNMLTKENVALQAKEVMQKNLSNAFSKTQDEVKAHQDGSEENLLKISALFATRAYLQDVGRKHDLAFLETIKTDEWKKFVAINYKKDNVCVPDITNILTRKELDVFCVNNLWNAFVLDSSNKDFLLKLQSNNQPILTENDYTNLQDFTKNLVEKGEEKTVEGMIDFFSKSVLEAQQTTNSNNQ